MKRKTTVLILAVLLLAGSWLWFDYWRPPPPGSASIDVVSALQTGNARVLALAATDEELGAIGLTRDQWQRIIEELVLPSFRGFVPVGSPEHFESDVMIGDAYSLRHPDGREVPLSVLIVKKPGGQELGSVVGCLVLGALSTRWKPGVPLPKGEERTRFWQDTVAAARPQLDSLGIKGYTDLDFQNQRLKLVTWDVFVSKNKR